MSTRTGRKACCSIFAGVIVVGIVFGILRLRAVVRGLSCLGNINSVGLAVRMYAQDSDDHLPAFAEWMDKAQPYYKTWVVFRCPDMAASEGFGYGLNNGEKRLLKIRSPNTYQLIYDSGEIRKNAFGPFAAKAANPPRHLGGCNSVSYADGHYKSLCREN